MPELNIHEDPILQAAEIISVMAFPNDSTRRGLFNYKVRFNLFLEERRRFMFGDKNSKEYVDYVNKSCDSLSSYLAPMLLHSDSYEHLMKKAFNVGAVNVGQAVIEMHSFSRIDNTYVGINRAFQFVVDQQNKHGFKLSKKKMEGDWQKYKYVAHLWAAYAYCLFDPVGNGSDLFLRNHKEILGLARYYQEFLLNYESSNNRKISFDPEKNWVIPKGSGWKVNKMDVEFTEERKLYIRKWNNNEYYQKHK